MRRFRVTFEAELSDRDVDMIGDFLCDNGAGTITFTPLDWEAEVCARLVRQADEERARFDEERARLVPARGSTPRRQSRSEGEAGISPSEHYSRADSTHDRDALRDALQHDTQRGMKW